MRTREEYNEERRKHLKRLKQVIQEIYMNGSVTKQSIAEYLDMHRSSFSRFLHEPERGLSDERLTKLEAWVEENK